MIQPNTRTTNRIENDRRDHDPADGETDLAIKSETRIKKPSMFRVFILNDDFTPMDFVVEVLETVFGKSHAEATQIMMNVHRKGVGLCGVYTYEIAETKVGIVHRMARMAEHPLQCRMEKA